MNIITRTVDVLVISGGILPVGAYGVQFVFNDGHDRGIFPLGLSERDAGADIVITTGVRHRTVSFRRAGLESWPCFDTCSMSRIWQQSGNQAKANSNAIKLEATKSSVIKARGRP
jgi:hypothetical protein